jgi:Mn-dependent DtxR family transcriptional regulator
MSDEVEARLDDLMGDPGTCAPGDPIPGSSNWTRRYGPAGPPGGH